MNGYLLDTNLLSELLRKRPSYRVLERIHRIPEDALTTSSVCVLELRYGAARQPAGDALWARISGELLPHFHVLSLGSAEATVAGELLAALESRGETIGLKDVLIGATALVHGLKMVTRNVRHFARIEGLDVESWWT